MNGVRVEAEVRRGNAAFPRYVAVKVKSSDGKREYVVDVTNGRCSCPGWTKHFPRKACKHLRALGYRG